MFLPVSSPTEVLEIVPESIICCQDPLRSIRYRVRDISNTEKDLYAPLSKATHSLLVSREGVKSIAGSSPSFLEDIEVVFDSLHHKPSILTEEAFSSEIKSDIAKALSSELPVSIEGIAKFGSNEQGDCESAPNISATGTLHSLGENDVSVLKRTDITDDFDFNNGADRPVGVLAFDTPAESSSRQDVFSIASVFDPKNMNHLQLFGLSDDEHDSNDFSAGQPDDQGLNLKLQRIENTPDNAELDIELDVIIGESYGIRGDLEILRKKHMKYAKGKTSRDGDVWASNDTIDVSNFGELVPDMAIEYPFNLDIFQKRAVYRLERDENVFVAAHTSAGKTVVAEYAIALAMQRKTKVIYTSPIKTLSNQKFRDFTTRFGDVGIITGDMSINPEASCLVMTTEILRSMLYKGADLIRDLSHVIFDECHWLNDPERGVVWEESIILLPSTVNIVMLSATVPNAMEFATWVGRTKQKPIYVVHTPKRPVPLSHNLFVKGEVFPLFDSSQGRFHEANYKKAAIKHKESTKNSNIRFGGGRNHAWMPIIKYLRKRGLDPAIFFCFSKKKCNEAADQLRTQDLTETAMDKNQIHLFYQGAIARLSPNDRNVPQISRHREMLKRGIGVHHAGILPIIKEITEVLFQKGYIRILFATETFAMGVNMPARTVVFTAIHKYDNQSFRLLEAGEYVQMAGRAGRRGLDDVGTVLLFPAAADFPVKNDVKTVLTGTPKPLRSQFRLTYNMILNLLRIDELRVEDVMARSFSEAPAGRTSGTVKKLLEKGNKTLSVMQVEGVELERFRELYSLSMHVERLSESIGKTVVSEGKNSAMSALGSGRVVMVKGKDHTFRVGAIIKLGTPSRPKGSLSLKPLKMRSSTISSAGSNGNVVKVLVLCGGPALVGVKGPLFQHNLSRVDLKGERKQFNASGLIVELGEVKIEKIMAISSLTISVNERGIVPIRGDPNATALSSAAEQLRDIALDKKNWEYLPTLHARKDLGLQDIDVEEFWEERKQVIKMMNEMVVDLISNGTISELESAFDKLSKESELEQKLDMLKVATSDESLQLMPDYRQRVSVLQQLGYIDGTSVRLKGRAACEVNTCESIILTELVFEKVIQKLGAVDLAGILSALVFTERIGNEETEKKVEDFGEGSEKMVSGCKAMQQVVHCLGQVQHENGLGVSGYEYVKGNVKVGFMRGVREWASGKRFSEICELYDGDVAEGTIVRTIVRLCELLREVKNVGRVIGDPELQKTADEAVALCRRDVIFAASLYVQ